MPDYSWSVGLPVLRLMIDLAPTVILELGSGPMSPIIARIAVLYSVEHDSKWVKGYEGVRYIFSSIVDGWYDLTELPDYDLCLVDGPPGSIGRMGFLDHLDLFDPTVSYIFHDVDRSVEFGLAYRVAKMWDKTMYVAQDRGKTQYALLF